MKILMIGGSKSGKSHLAQSKVKAIAGTNTMYYWATMEPVDVEDDERIKKHLVDRDGWGFETIECGKNIDEYAFSDKRGSILFDSVTALLANEMFRYDASIGAFSIDENAPERVLNSIMSVSNKAANFVCVADDILRDGTVFDETTEMYKRGLAHILRSLAAEFDAVYEVNFGLLSVHKGSADDI